MKLTLSKNTVDSLGCLILVGILAFVAVESHDYPEKSRFFVNICLAMLSVLTLVYIFQTVTRIYKTKTAGKQEKEPEDRVTFCNVKILGGVLAFALYVFVLIPYVGFYVSTALFTFGLSYFLGTKSLIPLVILSVAFPAVLFLGFQVGLSIHMPSGFLF